MPFYISLVLEYLARQLRKRSFSPSLGFGQKKAQTSSNPLLAALAGAGGGGDMITNTMLSLLMGGGGDSEAKRRERPVSVVEGNEWARRDSNFWWYLLRGPAWDNFTRCVDLEASSDDVVLTIISRNRPRLERFISAMERRPLLGLAGSIVSC